MSVPGQISGALAAYARAVLRNALIVTLLYIAGFAIAGVPWWLLVGFACGSLNVIPQIGSVIALGLVLLVQLFAGHGSTGMILAGVVWLE